MCIEGLILAAGLSSRCKDYKLTLELGGKPIISLCIEAMLDSCSKIVVVCGYKEEIIKKIALSYYNVVPIYNSDYHKEMIVSIKQGLKLLNASKVFLIPGDYPLVKKSTYKNLLKQEGNVIIPTFQGKKGHPILLSQSIIKDIIKDNAHHNLRDYLAKKDQKLVEVNDAGILVDIDTIEDYYRIYREFSE